MRLVLPVIYRKEEAEQKFLSGVTLTSEDFVIHHVIFYNIDAIEEVKNSKNECIVVCSGNDYRVALPMQEVDKKIMKQRIIYGYS